jgi:hypothetical protein
MKKIFGKLLKGIAVIALIPGILAWIAGISAVFFRFFIWYKTGEWHRLAIIEFIPDSWIVEANTNWPGLQKILFWTLNREIISLLLGFGLILMLNFIIMNIAARRCEEKLGEQPEPEIIVDRLKKLTRNE